MSDTQTSDEKVSPAYSVPPVERAFRLLRHIAAGNRCRNLNKTAKEIGINRTTLIRLLATLEAERMIDAVSDGGGYRLGTGLITLASQALNERGLVPTARPVLRQLVDDLNLSAHLGVRDGRDIVYLARETPNSHLASMVREGTRLPAHATTIGRILLASISTRELKEIYAGQSLKAFSDKTRTTLDDLLRQLESDRAQGISWSVANFEPDIGSAAVAIYDHQGQAVAAINVTGHASTFASDGPMVEEIEEKLKGAAREISEALGYRGWGADQM
ncbi:IclR family transcriptional regulator [Maritimibacter sp. UBA3975]|uniref:IclR family transcriptional regulator n=1 Tax=Maritimibacter sp. UBA3975 TaxID=1946833 RepID=UPI000C0A454D|nr:IclR family transcriptional regulator [Maritimibacter sp. UBA3975]MAM63175.1 IclR family transcriptional regulator [Maritimibacter sp.]|tara:strand:- start:28274 stop:29095 length:822 start_codon:yes stop_codon:yes gene_type:complete